VHCDTSELFDPAGRERVAAQRLPREIRFPEGLAVEPAHWKALEDYFRALAASAAAGAPAATGARARLGSLWRTVQRAIR
jgi:hypothetical protein